MLAQYAEAFARVRRVSRIAPIFAALICGALLSTLATRPARANGAFPDTGQILAPPDHRETIILGTNFGLVVSVDGGATWRWSCEHGAGSGGFRYALATADTRRLLGLTPTELVVTDDVGCAWQAVANQAGIIPFNYVPHVSDPSLVFALSEVRQSRLHSISRIDLRQASGPPSVLYTAPPDGELATIEVARSDANVIYATQNSLAGQVRTRIVRSTDGGQSWSVLDPAGAPDYVTLRIAAVDRANPQKLYLRGNKRDVQGEALLVSEDGGQTVRAPFETTGALVAFLRLQDGGALLAEMQGPVGHLHRSTDGANTFTELTNAKVHVRGLAERDGILYAATDNVSDGYAIGLSRDMGATWEKLMAFDDIRSVTACGDLPAICSTNCAQLAGLGVFSSRACTVAPPSPRDGGSSPAPDGGVDTAGGAGGDGGGCSLPHGGAAASLGTTFFALVAWALIAAATRRRPGRRSVR